MTELAVYYDFASAYCFVALEIVERLGARFPLRVTWRPFETIDYLPERGAMPQNPAFVRRAEATQVARLAREYSMSIRLSERLLNSNLALCAVEYVGGRGLPGIGDESAAGRLRRALFEAHFQEGRDISALDTVLDVARGCGVAGEMETALRGRHHAAAVAASRAAAIAMGVVAVPTWLAGGYGAVGVPEFSELVRLVELAACTASP